MLSTPDTLIIEKVPYQGWKNCWRIANSRMEAIVTADVGPRIIRFGFPGGQNLLKNYADQMGGSGEASWMIRGGSRIWVAPEDRVASYALDNSPVEVEVNGETLIATGPVEESTRIRKQMVIRAADSGLEITHRVKNEGALPVEFAIWVLTVMAPGGVAVTGFPPRGTHPENLDASNPLVMWPFTNLADPRWVFMKKYLALRQDPQNADPQKIGHFNPKTWAAYFLNGDLFIKRCLADPKRTYTDFGCSFETFTNAEMLEMETLGPLSRVAPGEWVEHTENWELHAAATPAEWTDESLDPIFEAQPGGRG